jgi:dTDP-4-amino-4,6-dideoxygalactose transaminase
MQSYRKLELIYGDVVDAENVVACSSGTAALHLALESLPIPRPSLVAIPDFSMIAIARAVKLAGHTPVLIDCNPDTLNMSNHHLKTAFNVISVRRGRGSSVDQIGAVITVHTYGRDANVEILEDVVKKNAYRPGMQIIEDLAEAHTIKKSPRSDAATWSFYKNKIIAGEEGGAVSFLSEKYAGKAKSLRCLGFTEEHDFSHTPRGHNYRLANTLADLILDDIDRVDNNVYARREVIDYYDSGCPDECRMPGRQSPWVYDVILPKSVPFENKAQFIKELNDIGIQARHSFKPVSMQEEFKECEVFGEGVSREMYKRVMYFPVYPETTSEEIDESMNRLYAFVKSN